MRRCLFLFTVVCCSLSSCEDFGKEAAKELKETAAEIGASLEKSADKVAVSVPGERYLRLVEDARSPDPEVQKRAKLFAKDLFNIDFDATYKASVWFGFDAEKGGVRADVFRSAVDDGRFVRWYCENKAFNPSSVKSSIRAPQSEKEMLNEMRSVMNSQIDSLSFAVEGRSLFVPGATHYDHQSEGYVTGGDDLKRMNAAARNQFRKVSDGVLKSFELAWSGTRSSYSTEVLRMNWSTVDPSPYIFVVILADDWDAHKGDIVVEAVVHKSESTESTLNEGRKYVFRREEFQDLKVDYPNVPGGRVMFASHNMTGNYVVTEDALKANKQFSELLNKYSK